MSEIDKKLMPWYALIVVTIIASISGCTNDLKLITNTHHYDHELIRAIYGENIEIAHMKAVGHTHVYCIEIVRGTPPTIQEVPVIVTWQNELNNVTLMEMVPPVSDGWFYICGDIPKSEADQ